VTIQSGPDASQGDDAAEPFAELLAAPGVQEVVELRSSFGFMAFHGGSLEERTDVIASVAAEAGGASYYGVLQPDDLRWHLPSTRIRPAASPALARFFEHVDVVVTIHGFGRHGYWTSLLLGGGNRRLAGHVGRHLRPALPGYDVITDLERIPSGLRGLHPENPVNRARRGGAQLELPPRARGNTPRCPPPGVDGLVPDARALVDALAAAARSWPALA
jgi:phage replication-related protein YjqB (UPF0714/DUF867 family)